MTYFERRSCLDPKQLIALAFQPARLGALMGIMMVRLLAPRFVAASMIAVAIIASTTASGWAFTQQMLGPGGNGNYNFNYSDPDHQNTGQSTLPSDPNGPGFHFNIEHGQTGPFSGFQDGNRSFGNSPSPTDPGYYIQPQGNGN